LENTVEGQKEGRTSVSFVE